MLLREMFDDIKFESNEESYLRDYFSIESEQEYAQSLLTYYSMETATLAYNNVELAFSAESLRDKISFHKSRLIILFKQVINELIRMVIEFFSIGTTQKKIMLMISKQLEEALKSLRNTLQHRLDSKGYYNFEDKSIEIRDTSDTILKPIVYLSLIGSVLNLDISKMIVDQYNKLLNNRPVKLNWRFFDIPSAKNDTVEIDKIYNALTKLGGCYGKISVILQMFSPEFIPSFTTRYIEDGISTTAAETDIGSEPSNSTVSLEGFKSLLGEKNPDSLSNYYRKITTVLGLPDITDSKIKSDHVTLYLSGLTEENFKNMFSTDSITTMKERADNISDSINDFLEEVQNPDEITIDSASTFQIYCKDLPNASKELAKLFKSIDYKKEMDRIRKDLDDVQKKINSIDPDTFEAMEEDINIMKYITAVTYQYNIAKSILHRYIRTAIKSVDNGITDMKKVEASIA